MKSHANLVKRRSALRDRGRSENGTISDLMALVAGSSHSSEFYGTLPNAPGRIRSDGGRIILDLNAEHTDAAGCLKRVLANIGILPTEITAEEHSLSIDAKAVGRASRTSSTGLAKTG